MQHNSMVAQQFIARLKLAAALNVAGAAMLRDGAGLSLLAGVGDRVGGLSKQINDQIGIIKIKAIAKSLKVIFDRSVGRWGRGCH